MADPQFYRGGGDLIPKPFEFRRDPQTGLLLPTHGVSVFDRPEGLERFGVVHRLGAIPAGLAILRRGRRPGHYEVVPAHPMALDEYLTLLGGVVLEPVQPADP